MIKRSGGSVFRAAVCWTSLAACSLAHGADPNIIAPDKSSAAEAALSRDAATVDIPPLVLPFSSFASPQAKAAFVEARKWLQRYAAEETPNIAEQRQRFVDDFQPALERVKALYPTKSTATRIAGVYTDVITPKDGIAAKNRNRVLINLHGGGFTMGARIGGALESMPVASLEKIEVVTIDYREGPEYKFPAATEDVVAVYKELLKSHKPQNIGVYGCSAGGLLTAEVTAWIEKQTLPMPGAIGIFCASAAGWSGGDSGFLSDPLIGLQFSADTLAPPHPQVSNAVYFSDADFNDPMVMPIRSTAILERFPPTLIVTSTRDIALSSAVYTHTQLTKLGVDAELHVWEGLRHGFFTSEPDLPESKEVWNVVASFFDKHLGHQGQR